jgi:Retroviral aspartyl protease
MSPKRSFLEIILDEVDKSLIIDKSDDVTLLPGFLIEAGEGMFTCDNHISIDCYVNEVLSHTAAHLHSYTSASQRIQKSKKDQKEKNVSKERLLQEYAYICEEAYLSGSNEINLNPSVENQTLSSNLRLRSVGLIRVDKIHNASSGKILKVLFDTGSDKTLINMHALPKQAVPAKDKNPSNITGLHNTKPLDRYVMLEGIQFPEFAPTSKVAKAIKAIVYNNNDSNYDVIIGMDVLQPLGYKIDCGTLTVSWNEVSILFGH